MAHQKFPNLSDFSFTFFLPNLRLINSCEIYGVTSGVDSDTPQEQILLKPDVEIENEGEERYILCDPVRRLGWHLLGRPDDAFGLRELPSSLYSDASRLHRAQQILNDVQFLEQKEKSLRADRTWEWVDREWHWAATSGGIRSILEKNARRFSVPNPEELAQKVQASITSELIPVLHLKGLIREASGDLSHTSQSAHERFLSTWAGEEASDPVIRLYIAYLNSLRNVSKASIKQESLVSAQLLEKSELISDATRLELSGTVAVLLNNWFATWVSQERQLSEISQTLDDIIRLFQIAPPNLLLMEIVSILYFLKASVFLKESSMIAIASAIDDLALSVSYDPLNITASKQLSVLAQEFEKLQKQLALTPSDQRGDGASVVSHLEEKLAAANDFGSTPDGLRILEARSKALPFELAIRLDLDPLAVETQTVLSELQSCLEEADEQTENTEEYPSKARQLAIAKGGLLAELDWPRIEEALEKLPSVSCEFLAMTLPAPAFLSSIPEDIQRIIDTAMHSEDTRGNIEEKPKPWLLAGTWLFSSQDALWKVAAVAGFLFILHGSSLLTYKAFKRIPVNKAYATTLASVADGNDLDLIHNSIAFLDQVPPKSKDPRVAQVTGFLQEATLREAVRLTQDGKEQEAVVLLDKVAEIDQQIKKYTNVIAADQRQGGDR